MKPIPRANGTLSRRASGRPGGGRGFADVWKKGCFAWEYKGKHKDLGRAYRQLLEYREDLQNPPLLVVCDTDRFEIHTNFTGTIKKVYAFGLDELKDNLDVLRAVFRNPERLKPDATPESITVEAAERVANLALGLSTRGIEPHAAAHFLMQLVFCMFAEDIGLLPDNLFTRIVDRTSRDPERFSRYVSELFQAMQDGGDVLLQDVRRFNGGLFKTTTVIPLTTEELEVLRGAARLDWSGVEPAIFGTLFERSLDPGKRHQLGAHYTSPEDIQAILDPVVFAPLRREWSALQKRVEEALQRYENRRKKKGSTSRRKLPKEILEAQSLIGNFLTRLRYVRILDPACGSGNFLYLALRGLKDLEGEVIDFGLKHGFPMDFPFVSPRQLYGIEINPYAQELAQVVVWIGHLQWAYRNGFDFPHDPVLDDLQNIRCADALLDPSDGRPRPTAWPAVDYIVGNPPFIGGKLMRNTLGDAYVDTLFSVYRDQVPREADFVTYWFERARQQLEAGAAERVGFVATNSIRGGANRRVLDTIARTGALFMAWADRPWTLDGAAVRVSMVGFDRGSETERTLDGVPVQHINTDLTGSVDLTRARRLRENLGISFMGDTKGGKFDVPGTLARQWLDLPNPANRSNRDVLRPWANGLDITRKPRDVWIIDFGADMPEQEAALYEAPFEYVRKKVKPERDRTQRARYREKWWIHARPRPAMRKALHGLQRYIVTPTVAKHRLFVFLDAVVLPDHQLIIVARDDYFTFGILHSRIHELWSLKMCTWLGVGNDPRYTPTTTFETFPFPDASREARSAVVEAAKSLDDMRGSVLKADGKRTLTGLYNERPTWLANLHAKLDQAVCAAYGWPVDLPDDEVLGRLLELNLAGPGRASGGSRDSA